MYGSVTGVASHASMWTSAGEFKDADIYGDGATNPTETTVETWLNELSSTFDVALANQGFEVPVVQAVAVVAIAAMVETFVADLVHAANSSGRFYTERAVEKGLQPMDVIRRMIAAWVNENTAGLENMGVPRKSGAVGKNEALFEVV